MGSSKSGHETHNNGSMSLLGGLERLSGMIVRVRNMKGGYRNGR